MKDYAKKYKLDFIEINDDQFQDFPMKKHKHTPSHLNKAILSKYRLPEICKHYKQVLYLDADVYISPTAENIFKYVPNDMLGVCKTEWVKDIPQAEKRDIDTLVKKLGYVDGSEKNPRKLMYWNAGVMVISKSHRYLFDHLDTLADTPLIFLEQSLFVYNSFRHCDKIKYLPISYNYPVYDGCDFNKDISTQENFYHTIGIKPKHEKSAYVHNCFKKEKSSLNSTDIFKPETYKDKKKILILGMQSSGSSFFTQCLSSFLPNYHTILDLWSKDHMKYTCKNIKTLDKNGRYIVKTTLTTPENLKMLLDAYQPDHKILICRDIGEVKHSLDTKKYKNNVVDLSTKISTYQELYNNKCELFDECYEYETYKNVIPESSIDDIMRHSLKCMVFKDLFLKECWGVGNIYGADHAKYFSRKFRKTC